MPTPTVTESTSATRRVITASDSTSLIRRQQAFCERPIRSATCATESEHLRVALTLSLRLLAAGIMCAVHALAPWLFTTAASRAVTRVYQEMLTRRGVPTDRSEARSSV
jgi:hypothetical protein